MNKIYLLLISLFTFKTDYNYNSSDHYKLIKPLSPDYHGWFSDTNAAILKQAILRIQPEVVVEIGSWLGSSAIFMGKLLKPNAKLYAIDHWMFGSAGVNENPEWSKRLPTLYQQFLSNVIHSQLTETIVPIRMLSTEAAAALDLVVDLIYIDGAHDAESVYQDIINWFPKLSSKGEIYGDDYFHLPVQAGVQRAARQLGKQIEVFGEICWHLI